MNQSYNAWAGISPENQDPPKENSQDYEDLQNELNHTRIQLQQKIDELDAVKLEFEFYKDWFRGLEIEKKGNDAQWLAQSWINALGGRLIPKHHLIDALVLTTQKIRLKANWPNET